MSLFVSCEESQHICDKNQYDAATFWEKVRLNLHLLICAICRKYTAQNMRLTRAIRNSNLQTLPQEQKNLIKEKLQKEMAQN